MASVDAKTTPQQDPGILRREQLGRILDVEQGEFLKEAHSHGLVPGIVDPVVFYPIPAVHFGCGFDR